MRSASLHVGGLATTVAPELRPAYDHVPLCVAPASGRLEPAQHGRLSDPGHHIRRSLNERRSADARRRSQRTAASIVDGKLRGAYTRICEQESQIASLEVRLTCALGRIRELDSSIQTPSPGVLEAAEALAQAAFV